MKQTGIHEITDELTLTDFSWEINSLLWSYSQDVVSIEVHFNGGTEARSFDWVTELTELTKSDCKDYLLTLPQFSGSTE